MKKLTVKRSWYASGSPFVWLNAGALAISLVMVLGTLSWIMFNGFEHFWPKKVFDANYEKRVVSSVDGDKTFQVKVSSERVIGQVFDVEEVDVVALKEGKLDVSGFTGETTERSRVKLSKHFKKFESDWLKDSKENDDLTVIERTINGNIYGYIHGLSYYKYDRFEVLPKPDWETISEEELFKGIAEGNKRYKSIYDDIHHGNATYKEGTFYKVLKPKSQSVMANNAFSGGVPTTTTLNACHVPTADMRVLTREEYKTYYRSIAEKVTVAKGAISQTLNQRVAYASTLRGEMVDLAKNEIGSINYKVKQLQDREKYFDYRERQGDNPADFMQERTELVAEYCELNNQSKVLDFKLSRLAAQLGTDTYIYEGAASVKQEMPVAEVVYQYQPNTFSWFDKLGHFFHKIWEFVAGDPREANSEGGVYPAIFGTVIMVLLMSIVVTPIGVIAAIYMHEYAKQGTVIRIVRVAVNNLAGVPSIVFGIFGLAFFVYFLGGNLDALFYPHLNTGVWGSPGLMWASLTLALMTLPVVIVSTEEGLSRIPRAMREGSLALGSTKWETLSRVVIPMASPGIMTGLILAIARAAGEVAPLMLVGVVKSVEALPVDGNFPFFHAERQFMHLGFHIYDLAFQSPDSEAVRGNVYATSALLIFIIASLNLFAVRIRNRLREKFRALQH